MARFRNDTGQVLHISDLGRLAGPGEEFTWPGYDPARHGTIPGCSRIGVAGQGAETDDPAGDGPGESEPGRRKAARRRPGSQASQAASGGPDTSAGTGAGQDTAGQDTGAEDGQEARS
jgi:hypothetical protein